MNALRSLLVFSWIVVSVIPQGIALLLCSPFMSADRLWWVFAVPWLKAAIWVARKVGRVDYRVEGLENLPPAEDMRRVILCPRARDTPSPRSSLLTHLQPSVTHVTLTNLTRKRFKEI